MSITQRSLRVALFATLSALFLAGCSTQQKIDHEEHAYSGYLKHYERMEPFDGDKAMRWVSGDLKKYDKVYVEPVELFPNFKAQNDAGKELAKRIADYLNNGFREGLAKRGKLADAPGPGVLVLKPAITGIVSETKDLKPRQYVLPVAIARTLIQTATDRRPAVVALYLEVSMEDGKTGKLEGEVLRKGLEKQSDNDKVTKDDVKALLDDWLEFYNEGLDKMFGQ